MLFALLLVSLFYANANVYGTELRTTIAAIWLKFKMKDLMEEQCFVFWFFFKHTLLQHHRSQAIL